MSYKKREIKTDEKTIAEFWEEYFKNEELIKKAFNHLHKRFPSENAMDSMHNLIVEFLRLETFNNFDPTRSTSTSPRDRYEVYLFNQVQKVLSYAYSRKRIDTSREIIHDEYSQNFAFEDLSITREVDRKNLLGCLKEALSDKHYKIVEHILQGFDNCEIALKSGVSSAAVGNRIKKIKEQILESPELSEAVSDFLLELIPA